MSKALQRIGSSAGIRVLIAGAVFATAAAYAADAKKDATPPPADPSKVRAVVAEQSGADAAAKASQDKINQLDDSTKTVVGEYRQTLQEVQSLKRYNEQMVIQVHSQEEEMISIAKELVQIETTSREVVPLLQKMLDTLGQFTNLDMPFLPDERKNRISTLQDMMKRADVSLSEKYRRIVEAYQIEMEYGRTLESYNGKVGDKSVEFLRVGRVALLYQTLDGSTTGYFDSQKKAFVEDNGYRDSIRSGLKIAKKQSAPDLLVVPVAAPQEIK